MPEAPAATALERIVHCQRLPDFAGWSRTIALAPVADGAGATRIVSSIDDGMALSLDELCLSLGADGDMPPDRDRIGDVLRLSAEIAQGSRLHPEAVWIRQSYDHFSNSVSVATGVALRDVTVGFATPEHADAVLQILRACLNEYLLNLWSTLRERGHLPLITQDRVGEMVEQATRMVAARPDCLGTLKVVAGIVAGAHFPAEARSIIEAFERRHPMSPEALPTLVELVFRTQDVAAAEDLLARWPAADTESEALVSARLTLYRLTRRDADASRLVLAEWDTFTRDAQRMAHAIACEWTAAERPLVERRLADLLRNVATPRTVFYLALWQLLSWGCDQAAAEAIKPRSDVAELGALAEIFARGLLPPLAPGDQVPTFDGRPLAVHAKPGSNRAIVVFAGVQGGGLGMPGAVVHRFLARLDCSIVYLADKNLCLGGIKQLGRTYAATIKALRKLLKDIGAKHVHVLGASGGGLPAIRYGLDLGADSILSLGGATNFSAEFLKQDRRGTILAKRLRSLVPEADHDLRQVMLRYPRRPRVVMRFGDQCHRDILHARHIADVPGVELRPITEWSGHDAFNALVLRHTIDAELRDFIGMRRLTGAA